MIAPIREVYIIDLLLKPLEELFGSLGDTKTDIYVDALRGYTDGELKRTFAYLRDNHEFKNFPSVASIQKAKKLSSSMQLRADGALVQNEKKPWTERQEKRDTATKYYLDAFIASPLYAQASREGWKYDLLRYVEAVAAVQAQLIYPHPNGGISFNHAEIFGVYHGSDKEGKQREAEWWTQQRLQAQTGRIEITLPHEHRERLMQYAQAPYLTAVVPSDIRHEPRSYFAKTHIESKAKDVTQQAKIALKAAQPVQAQAIESSPAKPSDEEILKQTQPLMKAYSETIAEISPF